MKIVTYSIKGTLERLGKNSVELTLSNDRALVSYVNLSKDDEKEMPSIAAKIGDENEAKKQMAKETLFTNQEKAEVTLELKFLE